MCTYSAIVFSSPSTACCALLELLLVVHSDRGTNFAAIVRAASDTDIFINVYRITNLLGLCLSSLTIISSLPQSPRVMSHPLLHMFVLRSFSASGLARIQTAMEAFSSEANSIGRIDLIREVIEDPALRHGVLCSCRNTISNSRVMTGQSIRRARRVH
ncbi:uncharacterized protein EI90DRAFT_3033574 [Cantharellus anzutake]|uniref:uncharacterized protein n=1 Tax=Cantharellus anzutake TaxID=1750568 RepID=UPI001905AD7D|nr:uncharacterized protein EI90DRAFT_3033574 [Cantharellus anzutake]KAF8341340.1 hypothetical protein EI90DRAFT_3033574 [Cantharellus anzutake]